jgi:hypothetical protein
MKDWIERLDEFIKISGNEILEHKGSISHQQAIDKAKEEYEKYKEQTKNDISEVEKHFLKHIDSAAKIIKPKK